MAKSTEQKLAGDKVVSLFRKRKLLAALIVLFLLLTTVVGVVTLYGLHTGGFTMSVSDNLQNQGILLYESLDGEGSSTLNGPAMSKVQPMAQPEINQNYVINNDGAYKSSAGDYIGYTFYIKNGGTKKTDIQSKFKITDKSKNMDSAIRFWVISSIPDMEREGNPMVKIGDTIYQKADELNENGERFDYSTIKTGFGDYKSTTDFVDDKTIADITYADVAAGSYIKISIIIWLEGADPDCEGIEGGSVKVAMAFSAYQEKLV